MLNQLEKVKDKWGGRSQTIDRWLQERQNLLIQYCHLAGLDKRTSAALPDANEISEFCTLLMDYISTGHFEVYEMLVSNNASGSALKREIYPLIADTTDRALMFNDKFTDADSAEQASVFDAELAALGQTLEERFELEDQLIDHMSRILDKSSSMHESV